MIYFLYSNKSKLQIYLKLEKFKFSSGIFLKMKSEKANGMPEWEENQTQEKCHAILKLEMH
jgi:hypothetical protein